MTYLIFQVTLEDHFIKLFSDIMDGSPVCM